MIFGTTHLFNEFGVFNKKERGISTNAILINKKIKMKARIIKKIYGDGSIRYFIEKKFLWWWVYDSSDETGTFSWDNYADAKKFYDRFYIAEKKEIIQ